MGTHTLVAGVMACQRGRADTAGPTAASTRRLEGLSQSLGCLHALKPLSYYCYMLPFLHDARLTACDVDSWTLVVLHVLNALMLHASSRE